MRTYGQSRNFSYRNLVASFHRRILQHGEEGRRRGRAASVCDLYCVFGDADLAIRLVRLG